ncbi:MAG: hypothetical protein ACJARP_002302 [Vicingaceae bacterium]|jgi:hypothetical protein
MNRLIMIGNGFDLAAGLKTSYEDFLVNYLKNIIIQATNNEDYTGDDICDIEVNRTDIILDPSNVKREVSLKVARINEKMKQINNLTELFKVVSVQIVGFTEDNNRNTIFKITVKSNFFLQLLGNYNWTDIEEFYYTRLLKVYKEEGYLKNKHSKDEDIEKDIRRHRKSNLVQLNEEFRVIRLEIIKYLKTIDTDRVRPFYFLENLKNPLKENIFKSFFNLNDSNGYTKPEIENIKFLNFNYTFTLENLFRSDSLKNYSLNDIIYIHGLTHDSQKIIFGYGDDTHEMYQKLELTGEDEYLKHLKSFFYPLSDEYMNLMRFLDSDQFEIQIIGHSLGLSDRLLLKTIFEHQNCRCIRLLHRGRDNEESLMPNRYMALSRHFDNKLKMRNKIYPFDMSDKIN